MPSRVRRLSPLVAFAAFLPALAAAQRPPLETIVLTGDPAPGIPGGAFSFIFGRATINTHGGIAFTASLPGGIDGLWRPDGAGSFELAALEGEPAPGSSPPVDFKSLGTPTLDDAGQVLFPATLDTTGDDFTGLYATEAAGTLVKVWAAGDLVPGATDGTTYDGPGDGPPQLNPSEETGAAVSVRPGGVTGVQESSLVIPDGPLALTVGLREDDPAPGVPGEVFGGFVNPVLDAAGNVAFKGFLAWSASVGNFDDEGIWAPDGAGGFALLAREGDPSPVPGRSFGRPSGLVGNAAGELAFADGGGTWKTTPGGLALVYEPGDVAPGTGGLAFDFVSPVAMNAEGRLTVKGTLPGPLGDQPIGYWVEAPVGGLRLVAYEGSPAPVGAPGVVFDRIDPPQMNAMGELVFYALLAGEGVDGSNRAAVFYADREGGVGLIARAGDELEVRDGDVRTIAFAFVDDGTGEPFFSGDLNDAGQYVVTMNFTDSTWGLFRGEVPMAAAAVPALGPVASLALAALLAGAVARAHARRGRP